jgi:hypothetical protein
MLVAIKRAGAHCHRRVSYGGRTTCPTRSTAQPHAGSCAGLSGGWHSYQDGRIPGARERGLQARSLCAFLAEEYTKKRKAPRL